MALKEHKAEAGKVWRSKIDGAYLSNILILGKGDKIENYEQVDQPVFEFDDDELPA